MKKYIVIIIVVFACITSTASAEEKSFLIGGAYGTYKVILDKSTVTADGKDFITIKASLVDGDGTLIHNSDTSNLGLQDDPGTTVDSVVPGYLPDTHNRIYFSDSTISFDSCDASKCISYAPLYDNYVKQNYAYFRFVNSNQGFLRIKSSTAGKKTIKLYGAQIAEYGGAFMDGSLSFDVTFTAPTASPSPIKTTATPTLTRPAAPIVTKLANKDLTKNTDGTFIPTIIRQGTPLILTGTTSANATVHLTIHSDPIVADAIADKDGNWTYTVDKDLALGDHTVDATVTDTNGQTSDSVTIAKFTLKAPITPVTPEPETAGFIMTPVTWGLTALAVALVPVVVWLEILRRRKNKFKMTDNPKPLM